MLQMHIPQLGNLQNFSSDIGILTDLNGLDLNKLEVRHYPDEPQITSLDVFKSILVPVERELVNNGHSMSVAVKIYKEVNHGQDDARECCLWLPSSVLDTRFQQGVNLAVSGVTKIDQELFFLPTLDLEYPHDDKQLSELAMSKLIQMGLSGHLITSGYSMHFIGDTFLKYDQNFWKVLGLFMKNLTYNEDIFPEEIALSREFGERILNAKSFEECIPISQEILKTYKSLPTGQMRQGLLYDPRWIAHKLIPLRVEDDFLGINPLRVTVGKNYTQPPVYDRSIQRVL